LRFAPPGSAVRIVASYHGERATLEVADAGPGVPIDERDRIFQRFQRGSETGGEGGFGLGLAIGRELAERQGGRLDLVEPDHAAPGAHFRLSLPIEMPVGSPPAQPQTAATG
jgi:signal transduction histidine kinase